jgi:hypothetical protein
MTPSRRATTTTTTATSYESWSGELLERAEATGLEGYRLLDVGCGTGLSFVEPSPGGLKAGPHPRAGLRLGQLITTV